LNVSFPLDIADWEWCYSTMIGLEIPLSPRARTQTIAGLDEICRIAEWSAALSELAGRSCFCPRCALVVHAVDLDDHLAVCSGTS